ncbi:hypothetical protein B0H14DRAFT_2822688, partial [Mycena olivaceomarginata]
PSDAQIEAGIFPCVCRLLALLFRSGFVVLMGPNGSDVPSWPWYLDAADAAHHGLVREMDRAARAGTAEDAFVVCPNRTSTRAGGMPWSTGRYKGADRIARPGALKRQWDSQEFFVNKRNPLCEKRLRRDSCPLLSPAPSHNNVNCTSVPCT